ncbi:MAG: membrane protein [Silanimonas sp.]|nr:MAG: membrane protein [Silanimonas sp.]GIX39999.1 MAG: membrane protein [Silanimonas sp.]
MQWMIYGANGYTGRLMAKEAAARGLKPILAGRRREALEALGRELDLEVRAFELEPAALDLGLRGVGLVLHCAGPFSATCAPMLEACLRAKAHYLDITGEIDVFAHCHQQDARAKAAGIVVLPGAGFDVVPTDCLAAQLKRELPDATSLVLAFEAGGGPSPGTAKTSVEGLGKGGRARIGGKMTAVPLAWKSRTFDRDGEPRSAMTIPWGDVYTAYLSTGIPDIEVYMAVPPAVIGRVRRLRLIRPLLGLGPVQRFMKARIEKTVQGPSEAKRGKTDTLVWGEVRNAAGQEVKRQLRTPNGYDLTVSAALGIVSRLLAGPAESGFKTPSLLMGADYVLTLPGVRRVD